MGEYADLLLNGEQCECCGEELMLDEAPGHPMYCSNECAKDRGVHKKDWKYLVVQHNND